MFLKAFPQRLNGLASDVWLWFISRFEQGNYLHSPASGTFQGTTICYLFHSLSSFKPCLSLSSQLSALWEHLHPKDCSGSSLITITSTFRERQLWWVVQGEQETFPLKAWRRGIYSLEQKWGRTDWSSECWNPNSLLVKVVDTDDRWLQEETGLWNRVEKTVFYRDDVEWSPSMLLYFYHATITCGILHSRIFYRSL